MLEEEHVPRELELHEVAEECRGEGTSGRNGHPDDAPPALRLVHSRSVDRHRAPVMADEDRRLVAAEHLVQHEHVGAERADLVPAVGWHRRRGVPSLERGDGPEPRLGQRGEKVPPGVGGVREPVQAQRQGAASTREEREVDAIGLDAAELGGGHGPDDT